MNVRDGIRRSPALATAVALILAVAGPAASLAQSDVDSLEPEFDRIAAAMAELRELPPVAEIQERFQTPEELRRELPAQIAEGYPPEEAAAEARSWAALGLVPAGTDLEQVYITLLGDQVAGYYDPETDEMVVVSEAEGFGPLEEFTYSHEAVHALQDAYLGLGDLIGEDAPELSDDAALALVSLYEGDATAASLDYVAADPALAAGLVLASGAAAAPLEGPAALAVWLIFPYTQGLEFVQALRGAGGWAAVDAAYTDPPTTTEQVLHPERFSERDEPTEVALPEAGALGEGWREIDQDTAGELLTSVILADLAEGQGFNALLGTLDLPEPARNAAAGWDGDRYALWSRDDEEVLVWRSVWDTEGDAIAFSRALQSYAQQRYGGEWTGTAANSALAGDAVSARLSQAGTEVAYAVAPTADLARSAVSLPAD